MQDEANIVKQYEEANVSGRIEILIKYYPNFIRLLARTKHDESQHEGIRIMENSEKIV